MKIFDVPSLDDPRRAFAVLLAGDGAGAELAQHRHGAQIEYPGRLGQRDLATLSPFAVPMDRDAVRVTEASDPRLRPPVQPACSLSRSVEHAGDRFVGHQSRAYLDQLRRLGLDAPARLPSPVLLHREAGVVAALPMQQQLDLVILNAGHDLAQHDTNDALARDRGCRWMMPHRIEIVAHAQQALAFLGAQGGRLLPDQRLQVLLQRAYGHESGVPAPFELSCNETVVGIDGVVLPPRPACLVSRVFERKLDLALLLAGLVLAVRDGPYRRFDAEGLQQPQDLGAYRLVDP